MNFRKYLYTFIVFLFTISAVNAQTRAELEKQREKLNREIAELQKTLQETAQEKALTQKQISTLSTQISLREQKINTITAEVRIINGQINSNVKEVDKLKAELEKMKKDYEKMILFAFRNRNAYNKLMFIFASKDFNQGFRRVKYLQQFNDSRKEKAAEIEGTKKKIEQKIAQLTADRNKQNQLLKEQESERQTIAKQRSVYSSELSEIIVTERGVKRNLTKKQQEERKIRAAIQAIIKREIEARRRAEEAARRAADAAAARKSADAKSAPATKPAATAKKSDAEILRSTPEATRLSNDFRSNRGRLPWPVASARVVQNFGGESVGRNVQWDHQSVKIQTENGASVKAVFSGTVSSVLTIYGQRIVMINHGEYYSVYTNLANVGVSKGQKVSTGQTIGTVDMDSDSGVPVLEFAIFQASTPLNPMSWLAR